MARAADHDRIDAPTGFWKVTVRRDRAVVATAGHRLLGVRAQPQRVDIQFTPVGVRVSFAVSLEHHESIVAAKMPAPPVPFVLDREVSRWRSPEARTAAS